jgi:hypothetical protein
VIRTQAMWYAFASDWDDDIDLFSLSWLINGVVWGGLQRGAFDKNQLLIFKSFSV